MKCCGYDIDLQCGPGQRERIIRQCLECGAVVKRTSTEITRAGLKIAKEAYNDAAK